MATAAEVRATVPPAPAVFECSGHPEVLHTAADLVAPGGAMVMVGVPFGEAKVAPLMWVTREIAVLGSIASSDADFVAPRSQCWPATQRSGASSHAASRSTKVPAAFEDLIAPSSGGKVVVDPHL